MSLEPDSPRAGSLVPSKGIEWSFIWLAVGILGMVFLIFALLGTKSDDKTPSYDRDSQITPRAPRDRPNSQGQPEIGASENTESS
ncbi:MAG: hypothetical protein IAG10_19185 [Planctomycetaceae bacterium]|nr:hypothetical protein [Planctomycetaceae bacterium]